MVMATKIFLALNALAFIGYGLVCLVQPSVVADAAGLQVLNADGSTELRAMYGGLQTAVGMLALAGLLRVEMRQGVLLVLAFLFFGLASARALGVLMDSGVGSYTWGALVFEIVCVVIATTLFGRGSGEELSGNVA